VQKKVVEVREARPQMQMKMVEIQVKVMEI
jgi:hypothetical protein